MYIAPLLTATARELTDHTVWTWKDITTRAAYGHLWNDTPLSVPTAPGPLYTALTPNRLAGDLTVSWETLEPMPPIWLHASLEPPATSPRTVTLRGLVKVRGWYYTWTPAQIIPANLPAGGTLNSADLTGWDPTRPIYWALCESPLPNPHAPCTVFVMTPP